MQATPTPTPELIGAATAEQGNLADTALQPGDLAGQIRAWAVFDGRPGGGLISWINVASVARTSAGVWVATITVSPVGFSRYPVQASAFAAVTWDSISTEAVGADNIVTINHTEGGSFVDSAVVSFIAVW